jgi:hypothetical protein
MQLRRHHRIALATGLGLSGIALFDAVTHGVTGHWSAFSDDGDVPAIIAVGNVVHGLAYAGGVLVLHAERARLTVNRPAAVSRWLLLAAFAVLGVGFLLLAPFQPYDMATTLTDAVGPVIGVAFLLQFLAALGLGLSLLRYPDTGVGSRVLAGLPLVVAATVVVAVVAGDWAHPAYVETATILGVALLGTAAPSVSRDEPSPAGPRVRVTSGAA